MRRRAERALVIAVLVIVAGGHRVPLLRRAQWSLEGAWELARLPSVAAAPPIAAPAHIAHAGGAFGALRYTNSLEALDWNYARGVRWFELDFLPDPEGAWWAVHDWREVQELQGIAPFHVLTLDEALAWFGRHGDARLITDTRETIPFFSSGWDRPRPGCAHASIRRFTASESTPRQWPADSRRQSSPPTGAHIPGGYCAGSSTALRCWR